MRPDSIIVVSGIPRSGTSMMMQILSAGGIALLTDHTRKADSDNPRGYFEFEKTKELAKDKTWLHKAKGKAVKIISQLLKELPSDFNYKIIFMERTMEEILASQNQMLLNRGTSENQGKNEQLGDLFKKHLAEIKTWLTGQSNFDVTCISFNEVLKNPAPHLLELARFLDISLNLKAMLAVIDKSLYRQKAD